MRLSKAHTATEVNFFLVKQEAMLSFIYKSDFVPRVQNRKSKPVFKEAGILCQEQGFWASLAETSSHKPANITAVSLEMYITRPSSEPDLALQFSHNFSCFPVLK